MRRFLQNVFATATLAGLAACATPPGSIEAKAVTDARFANLDCPLLITERDHRMTIRALLEDAQKERFRADLITGALTGMTQSMVLSPKAREEKIAEVKGEILALNREITAKNCQSRIAG
jgi:hypothetical protein